MSDYRTLKKPTKIEQATKKYKQAAGEEQTIKRLAFVCEFTESAPPSAVIETVSQLDRAFILTRELSDNYYTITGTVKTEHSASKINAELCSEWMRVYIDHDHTLSGVQHFLTELHTVYPFNIVVATSYIDSEDPSDS